MSMGVYIKGMEMPKSCCSCPLFKSTMSKQLFCKAFGAFDKSDYDKLPIERMKNCPLISIPPHGDLIDRDVLMKGEGRYMISFGKEGIDVAEIDRAPTIIPAEEGET